MEEKETNPEPTNSDHSPKPKDDEIGAIGIGLAITALAAGAIFIENIPIAFKIVFLIIYILGGLSSSFLYYTFLGNCIPQTMHLWASKGGLNGKGIIWIFRYYSKLLFRQMMTTKGNTQLQIKELGYLTILAMLSLLWDTFFILLIVVLLPLFAKNV
jgi:hypothetical protein